jgi:hypothetical protein
MPCPSRCTTCITISGASIRRCGLPLAMAAGVTDKLWSVGDIVSILEAWEMASVHAKEAR